MRMKPKIEIRFATGNPHKVEEANSVGMEFGIVFAQLSQDYPEIRAEAVEDVATQGARYVFDKVRKPVIVEDTGLYVKALGGFPGAYAKFVYRKIGNEGLIQLLSDKSDRSARFVSAIGYCDGRMTKTFAGEARGTIISEQRGDGGFGYDPVFVPEGYDNTFGENYKLKQKISHRKKAFTKFCEWIIKESKEKKEEREF